MTREEAYTRLNLSVALLPVTLANVPGRVTEGVKRPYPLAATHLTIHETDNTSKGAGRLAHARYLRGEDAALRRVVWHYTIDDGGAVKHLPVSWRGSHAGTRAGNGASIGLELCVNEGGDVEATRTRAALLTALLRHEEGIPQSNVVQHHHWSGKDCPETLRRDGWAEWLSLVSDLYRGFDF